MPAFDFLKFQALIYTFAPLVLKTIEGGDKILPYVPQIVDLIREAEQINGASGPEKKAHVLAGLKTAIEIANRTGRVMVDAESVLAIASPGIDVIIAVINLVGRTRTTRRAGDAPAL